MENFIFCAVSVVLGKNCIKLFHFIEKGNKKTDRLKIFGYVDLFRIKLLRYFNILQLLLEKSVKLKI